MTISADLESKIARYYYVEKWRVNTIARQLGIHYSVVKRVLSEKGVPQKVLIPQGSLITPFLPFVQEQLRQYPKLTAQRLYHMVCERGYEGGPDHFRHTLALYRPKPATEAYLRLRTLPGEQSQVDWAHFGYLTCGKVKRPLMAFVMVLSFSRKIFLQFYLHQRLENFLRGHEEAFKQWGGVPRVLLYDNLKSAVLERVGDAIRFNSTFLDFSAHYRFEPRPVAVARGNEKGRVERAIRYVRDNFFAARLWKDLEDLNGQALTWCEGVASQRPCPEARELSVEAAFQQERSKLIALPNDFYPTQEKETVSVGKTPYVRFDLNDYSVPHTYVRQTLTVLATLKKVTILKDMVIIAEHERCFDKAQQIEDPAHIEDLVKRKKKARQHRGQNRLTYVVPCGAEFLKKAAAKGYHLGSTVASLLRFLDDYGAISLEAAIKEALLQQVPHPNTVKLNLDKHREQQQLQPPIHLDLPNDKRVRECVVRPHKLENYDQLQTLTEKKNDNETK